MRRMITGLTWLSGRVAKQAVPLLSISLLILVVVAGFLSLPDKAQATGTINTCDGCHGNGPLDNATRDGATGRFPGSHNTHAGAWYTTTDSRYSIACEVCHFSPNYTSYNHQGDTIQINLRWFSMAGNVVQGGSVSGWGSYSRGTAFTNWATVPTSSFGICTNTYCHSNGTGGDINGVGQVRPIEPNISPKWSTNTPLCTPCHGHETGNPGSGAPWYTSGWDMTTKNWGSFKANSHRGHAATGNPCFKCHNATTSTGTTITSVGNHIKMNYSVVPGPGISYTYAYTSVGGRCTQPSCHSSNASSGLIKQWGSNNSTTVQCVKCHGVPWATLGHWNTDKGVAAPGYWQTGRNTWDTVGAFTNAVSNAAKVWAHNSHLNSQSVKGYTTVRGVECDDCHAFAAIQADIYSSGHMNGSTQFAWSSLVRNVGNNNPKWNTLALQPWYSSGNQQCGNIYCHGQSITVAGMWGSGWSSLTFNNNQWLTVASAKDAKSCNQCHQSPPWRTINYNHSGMVITDDCAGCHNHNGSGASHIDGTLYGGGSCTGCHNGTPASPVAQALDASVTNRRNVVAEFNNTWSHTRSRTPGPGTVTDKDCCACHMECDAATVTPDTAYHKNGIINLRDPDTGQHITWVSFVDPNGGWTTATGWATFVRFKRNLSDNVIEAAAAAVQLNQCLHCHDSNGAANSTAWGTGGSQYKPFGATIAGAWYTGYYTANQTVGGVVNVDMQFWTSRAAYHPVLGRRWSTFAKGTRMNAPWATTVKPWGSFGYLISCWDCHAASAQTGWVTNTVTAHGAPATLRGLWGTVGSTAALNLCVNCHATTYATTSTNHGAGSAFGSGANSAMNATTFGRCYNCHAATYAATGWNSLNVRPIRGENVHGVNDRNPGQTGSSWATLGTRPFAFIRNSLVGWRPATGAGLTAGTNGSCFGTGGTCNNNMSPTQTYTPGGRY